MGKASTLLQRRAHDREKQTHSVRRTFIRGGIRRSPGVLLSAAAEGHGFHFAARSTRGKTARKAGGEALTLDEQRDLIAFIWWVDQVVSFWR